MIKLLILLSTLILPFLVEANNKKLSIPRFVSIKSNEVNARTGPTIKCPIEWVFVKKGEPVEIIAEYGQWRKIQDIKGEGGWVHSSVLSGKRSVIITANEEVALQKSPNGKVIAKILPLVRCYLKKCQACYCHIQCKNYVGWVSKEAIWGAYPDEKEY